MSRIQTTFEQLKKQNKKALIPYITAGDPNPSITVPLMHAFVAAGVNLIELGIPFSDPMAEGPVIQAAHERALAHGVTLTNVISMVQEFRQQDKTTPIVLMGYLNPIEHMGYKKFAAAAQQAGVDGVIIVDFPPEEATELLVELRQQAIDMIFLLAPTTTPTRIKYICEQAGGFHYYVSMKGVTGSAGLNTQEVASKLAEVRQYARLPIGVGFGIRDAQSAKAIAALADAVIVGAAVVGCMANATDLATITQQTTRLLREMRTAMDEGN